MNTHSVYDYVMARLDSGDIPQRIVAQASGVPFSTLTKIAQRRVKNPGVLTVERIAQYFKSVGSSTECQCRSRRLFL